MDTLLTNAVQSIQIGVEDYEANHDRRRVLSAVRNIQAGILLLCKEHLRALSPPGTNEVFIRAKIAPVMTSGGVARFEGRGETTVNQQQIIERFRDLGIRVDWAPLRRLTNFRNELEHYRTDAPHAVLREAVAQSALIIRELIQDVLGEDPADLLGFMCWTVLLDIESVYTAAFNRSQATLAELAWRSPTMARAVSEVRCRFCKSGLVEQTNAENTEQKHARFRCGGCSNDLDGGDVIERALLSHLYTDLYLSYTDGGERPIGRCPTCGFETVVLGEGICANCGSDQPEATCGVCGKALDAGELSASSDLCGYHLYVAEMDD